ncbi:carbon storage regulator CsrA [Caminibacter sp.]
MLVISRKENQKIKIGEDIELVIVEIGKNQVKIGIDAPQNIKILRGELVEEITKENKKANKEISYEQLKSYSKALL